MKNKFYPLLFLPAVALALMMIYYTALCNFQRVEVVVMGYDPKDFFSGYYMNLQPNWDKTDCSQFENNLCPQKEFEPYYNYYINRAHSDNLTKKVNAGVVKLVFSYRKGHRPLVTDLLVDGESYFEYFKER
ncbi:MAG: hypothetical protein J6Y91_03175 [Alphaproteobacteria bacterium]|nr:hypothetical protein [Alphaproteobacteria bacterium]